MFGTGSQEKRDSDSLASRKVLFKPSGFEEQVIELSYPEANLNDRNKYLFEDVVDNPEQTINIGFMIKNGHARVVIRPNEAEGLSKPDATMLNDGQLAGMIYSLHIRRLNRDRGDLVLALDDGLSVRYERFLDAFRISVRRRIWQHWALISCPPEYRLVEADCATFTYLYMERVVKYCMEEAPVGMRFTGEEGEKWKELLAQRICIKDGLSGQSEGISRRNPSLGQSANITLGYS